MSVYKAGIFGCKNMGGKHLKVLREFAGQDVNVVAVMNSTPESSAAAAQELKTGYFKKLEQVSAAQINLAIVATPATYHYQYAAYLLSRGIPCLVEKPYAMNEQECLDLIKIADENKATLMVGYQEVFNPAVIALKKELAGHNIVSYQSVRETLSFGSNTDTTIVPNLMSHDLSVLHYLTGLKAADISELQTKVDIRRNPQSYAHALIGFRKGLKADLIAQVSKDKVVRSADITDDSGNLYNVDFMTHELRKNGRIITSGGNPLANEHQHFIHCCRTGETPLNNGREALEIERLSGTVDRDFQKNYYLTVAMNRYASRQGKNY